MLPYTKSDHLSTHDSAVYPDWQRLTKTSGFHVTNYLILELETLVIEPETLQMQSRCSTTESQISSLLCSWEQ